MDEHGDLLASFAAGNPGGRLAFGAAGAGGGYDVYVPELDGSGPPPHLDRCP